MRILYIEDEEYNQIVVRESLKLHFGMEVVSAYNGQEGLDKLNSGEKFDCIILDVRMPVMDGDTFLEKYTGPIPIIYASAYKKDPPRSVAAIMPKPFSSREIGAEILRITSAAQVAKSEETP